jgi:hypothetical protein
VRPEDLPPEARDAYKMWRSVFNLSESAALAAVCADGLVDEPESDRLAGSFANVFGLSEAAAKVAARGRDVPVLGASRSGDDVAERRLQLAEQALAAMSDSEVNAMFVEEQKRRKAAKGASPVSGGAAKKSATVVSERGRFK